jgi:hypothetical protein
MTYGSSRYTVPKNTFFTTLTTADHLVNQLGLRSALQLGSHRYNIYDIQQFPLIAKSYSVATIEDWLHQHFIPDIADWMIQLENDSAASINDAQGLEFSVSQTHISTTIQPQKFTHAKQFISEQLNIGLMHQCPATTLIEPLQRSHTLAARKITDQLKSMNDKWKTDLPTWRISIKTILFESQMMCILMKYGLICIHFYYPATLPVACD